MTGYSNWLNEKSCINQRSSGHRPSGFLPMDDRDDSWTRSSTIGWTCASLKARHRNEELYPDYQLDDLLVESMIGETQEFFAELVRRNLGVTNLVASDFAMLNERLAMHYGFRMLKA